MEPNQDRSIVPQPSLELAAPPIGANRILGEMVESSLAVANVVTKEAELDALMKEARRLQEQEGGAGNEMAPNNVRAFHLLLRAAEGGHAEAQYEVSYCLSFGVGVRCDQVQADRWMALAAEQGFAEAQFKMGNPFNNNREYGKAAQWYRKAAEQGHSFSQQMLTYFYSDGRGLPQDFCQAYAWAKLAADPENVEPTANGSFGADPDECEQLAASAASVLSSKQLEIAHSLYLDFKRKYQAKR